jgi:hypothetical protein
MLTKVQIISLIVRGAALLFWMIVIFSLSAMPGSGDALKPTLLFYMERKGAHVVEYALLTLLAIRFTSLLFSRETFKRILLLSAVFALAYGATDELHQTFVPFRGGKISDVLVDSLGILLTISICYARHAGKKSVKHLVIGALIVLCALVLANQIALLFG